VALADDRVEQQSFNNKSYDFRFVMNTKLAINTLKLPVDWWVTFLRQAETNSIGDYLARFRTAGCSMLFVGRT
jgi:hypothetical protein